MSRAGDLLEAIIKPKLPPQLLGKVRQVILSWAQRNSGSMEARTNAIVVLLNRDPIFQRFKITLEPDRKNGPRGAARGLFTGGHLVSTTSDIVVFVRERYSPDIAMSSIDKELIEFESIINHEGIHRLQQHRDPTGGYKTQDHRKPVPSFQPYKPLRDEEGNPRPRMPHPKSMARTAYDRRQGIDAYLARPEEIMAHANQAATLLAKDGRSENAYQIINRYSTLGKDHPSWKLFVKYLVQYYQRLGGKLSTLNTYLNIYSDPRAGAKNYQRRRKAFNPPPDKERTRAARIARRAAKRIDPNLETQEFERPPWL